MVGQHGSLMVDPDRSPVSILAERCGKAYRTPENFCTTTVAGRIPVVTTRSEGWPWLMSLGIHVVQFVG